MSTAARLPTALIALAIAAPGLARGSDGLEHNVRVQRVAVHSRSDARRMERRIAAAALEACGASSFSLAAYRGAVARSDCYAAALGDARAQLVESGRGASTPHMDGR